MRDPIRTAWRWPSWPPRWRRRRPRPSPRSRLRPRTPHRDLPRPRRAPRTLRLCPRTRHRAPSRLRLAPRTPRRRAMDAPPLPERSRPAAMAPAPAQQAAAARHAAPPLISTHQINRYDAINQLQAALKANPNSLADWVILGELSHEAALDAPRDHAAKFYQMSRDAYERALTLDPNTAGLKAAVQFARDREAVPIVSSRSAIRRRGPTLKPAAATWPRPATSRRSALLRRRPRTGSCSCRPIRFCRSSRPPSSRARIPRSPPRYPQPRQLPWSLPRPQTGRRPRTRWGPRPGRRPPKCRGSAPRPTRPRRVRGSPTTTRRTP